MHDLEKTQTNIEELVVDYFTLMVDAKKEEAEGNFERARVKTEFAHAIKDTITTYLLQEYKQQQTYVC